MHIHMYFLFVFCICKLYVFDDVKSKDAMKMKMKGDAATTDTMKTYIHNHEQSMIALESAGSENGNKSDRSVRVNCSRAEGEAKCYM